jgi:hypothetical protein
MTEKLNKAVDDLVSWAWCDVNVDLSEKDVLAALMQDGGEPPTDDECQLLVCGDDSGEIPEELKKRFPALDALLSREIGA